jgi:hypothetical protein
MKPNITTERLGLGVELTSLLAGLRIQVADPGALVDVLLLRAWVVRLAVRGPWPRGGVTDDTDHHLYDRLRSCQDRASRDATSGMHGAMAEIPRNRRRWVLPAALVLVGVLMMVLGTFRQGDHASAVWRQLGSALALFGPLYGAQRMLERRSPSKSRLFVVQHRRAGE